MLMQSLDRCFSKRGGHDRKLLDSFRCVSNNLTSVKDIFTMARLILDLLFLYSMQLKISISSSSFIIQEIRFELMKDSIF